ncbi:MAG: hypothetical protein JXR70_15985 [Spirochaetales bacterium]|nr:hypothetical protein [Spirochaetales bacterium]
MRSRKQRGLLVLFLLMVLIFPGCVSEPTPSPDEGDNSAKSAPDWFFNTPPEDSQYKYYVGSGTSEKGDLGEAEDIAIQDLIDSIFLYIGVEITSDTTAEARASLEDFQTEITSVVKKKGEAKFSGFEIIEKLPNKKDDGTVTLYLLSRYNKAELEKEKRRIQAAFEERYEAISIPEQEGQSLVGQNRHYNAAIKFIEAAAAASTANVTNREVKFERNLNQAKEAVENISLIPINPGIETFAGEPFPETFQLKVVNGNSEDSPGIADAVITISYPILDNNGKKKTRTKMMKSDDEGYIYFDHPVPEFVGSEKITLSLDMDAYMEQLWDVPAEYDEMVTGLEELIANKRATMEYVVSSNAKNIATGIIMLDLNETAEDYPSSLSGTSILSTLSRNGFSIQQLPLKPRDIKDKGDYVIIEMLKNAFSDRVRRVIFGTARILNYGELAGRVSAKSTISVQVIDLENDEILYTTTINKNGLGADEDSAAKDAFKKLGEAVGEDIKNRLH